MRLTHPAANCCLSSQPLLGRASVGEPRALLDRSVQRPEHRVAVVAMDAVRVTGWPDDVAHFKQLCQKPARLVEPTARLLETTCQVVALVA
eukprot:1880505-Prymnesium_polylepis.1